MPDPQRLRVLVELREAVPGMTQAKAARLCGLEGRQSYKTFGDWELGNVIPEAKRRTAFLHYLWDGLRLRQNPDKFQEVWQILEQEWGWEPLTDDEWRDLTNPPPPERCDYAPPHTARTALSPAHRKYLPSSSSRSGPGSR